MTNERIEVATVDRDSLVRRHQPLVSQVVFQVAVHFPRHVDREELARCGVIGLVEAARRFEPSRGIPFERFAAQRIRGAILDGIRAADWAPRSVRTLGRKLEQATSALSSELGRAPTLAELAQTMELSVAEVAEARERVHRAVVLALDHHVGVADDLTLGDLLVDRTAPEPEEELETRELRSYLRDAVSLLPERLRLVVVGYFLEGRTSRELADFLGVTESRISQLRSEALRLLRSGIESQYDAAPATRDEAFAGAIAGATPWRQRLSAAPVPA